MRLHCAMHHWERLFRKPYKWHFTHFDRVGSIPEKKKVAAVESWCHRLGDDNDDRDVGACDNAAALPRYKQIADSKQRVK